MRDLVLIPTFARPEYLALCLEHLAAADGAATKEVWIAHDRHHNDSGNVAKEIALSKQVVAAYDVFKGQPFAAIRFIERAAHHFIGNPSNFLELYKEAYNQPDVRYIYLVEDDVLVGKDFFTWHEAVQALGDYFCTVGWHCIRNPEVAASNDPTGYIESTRDFSSIGVCWKREKLEPFVRHAHTAYYSRMAAYLGSQFPGSPIPAGQWTEQAGVVTRLLHETRDRWVAWPTVRRCSHVGVSGYHRPHGHRFAGELGERITALRAAVSTDKIVGMNKDFGGDIEPLLPYQPWEPEQLHVTQRFEYVPGKI